MLRWLLIGLVCWSAASARADVFVIAPPYYEGTDGRAVSDEIVRLVSEDLSKQHEVVGPLKAASLVPKADRVSCPEGACAERYREAAGAVAAIVVRVGRVGPGPGLATSFQLGIQPAPGLEYTDGALLADGALAEVVVKVLREAFRQYRQGPGPWLEITGAPTGASVFIDDRASGTLPTTLAVQLGTHQVRIEAQTFESRTQVVSLLSPTARAKLAFHLEPARVTLVVNTKGRSMTAGPVASPAKENVGSGIWTNPWLYVGAGALVGGAVLVVGGALDHGRAGDCRARASNGSGCTALYEFGGESKALLGGGVALAAVGAALVTWSIVGAAKEKNVWQAGVDVGPGRLGIGIGGKL